MLDPLSISILTILQTGIYQLFKLLIEQEKSKFIKYICTRIAKRLGDKNSILLHKLVLFTPDISGFNLKAEISLHFFKVVVDFDLEESEEGERINHLLKLIELINTSRLDYEQLVSTIRLFDSSIILPPRIGKVFKKFLKKNNRVL